MALLDPIFAVAAGPWALALLYFFPERPWLGSRDLFGFALTLPHSFLSHLIVAPGLFGSFHLICSTS